MMPTTEAHIHYLKVMLTFLIKIRCKIVIINFTGPQIKKKPNRKHNKIRHCSLTTQFSLQ